VFVGTIGAPLNVNVSGVRSARVVHPAAVAVYFQEERVLKISKISIKIKKT